MILPFHILPLRIVSISYLRHGHAPAQGQQRTHAGAWTVTHACPPRGSGGRKAGRARPKGDAGAIPHRHTRLPLHLPLWLGGPTQKYPLSRKMCYNLNQRTPYRFLCWLPPRLCGCWVFVGKSSLCWGFQIFFDQIVSGFEGGGSGFPCAWKAGRRSSVV